MAVQKRRYDENSIVQKRECRKVVIMIEIGINLQDLEDHTLSYFKWEWWQLYLFIVYYIICAVIAILGQIMIVFYIAKHAPKNRPINKMILVDQVSYQRKL